MTAPGELKRRLVLEAPSESDDGAGGVVRGYAAVTTLWAQVTPSSMRGETDADSVGTSSRYRIVVRARADVTTLHRFVEGTRVYRILAMRDSADRRFLEVEAEVRGD